MRWARRTLRSRYGTYFRRGRGTRWSRGTSLRFLRCGAGRRFKRSGLATHGRGRASSRSTGRGGYTSCFSGGRSGAFRTLESEATSTCRTCGSTCTKGGGGRRSNSSALRTWSRGLASSGGASLRTAVGPRAAAGRRAVGTSGYAAQSAGSTGGLAFVTLRRSGPPASRRKGRCATGRRGSGLCRAGGRGQGRCSEGGPRGGSCCCGRGDSAARLARLRSPFNYSESGDSPSSVPRPTRSTTTTCPARTARRCALSSHSTRKDGRAIASRGG